MNGALVIRTVGVGVRVSTRKKEENKKKKKTSTVVTRPGDDTFTFIVPFFHLF